MVLGRAGIVPTATAIGSAPFVALAGVTSGGATPVAATDGDDFGEGTECASAIANLVDRVLARLRDDLGRAVKKLGDLEDPAVGACLDRLALALVDGRLRERIIAAAAEPSGLRSVAKDYARAASRIASRRPPTTPPSSIASTSTTPLSSITADAISSVHGPTAAAAELDAEAAERVAEIEELCALIGLTADARTSVRPGGIWIADRVGAVMTIAAIARGAAALVASDRVTPTALAIAAAAKLPVVSGVAGLFGWVRTGDLLAVDGESGTVLVHPAPTEIERLRRERNPT